MWFKIAGKCPNLVKLGEMVKIETFHFLFCEQERERERQRQRETSAHVETGALSQGSFYPLNK